ncbi:MAG: hypothetical protein U0350_25510 [Caldilineaceae bacterium]
MAQTPQAKPVPKPEEKSATPPPAESDNLLYFQYVGATGLTLKGPLSGKRYRFDSPGALVLIDPRDKRALAGVSVLRQVRNVEDALQAF